MGTKFWVVGSNLIVAYKEVKMFALLCQHTCGASKPEEQNVNLSLEINRQAAPYSKISKQCLLCLHEKLAIALYSNPEELLNKRSEMISKSHDLNKFLLMNFNSNDEICP